MQVWRSGIAALFIAVWAASGAFAQQPVAEALNDLPFNDPDRSTPLDAPQAAMLARQYQALDRQARLALIAALATTLMVGLGGLIAWLEGARAPGGGRSGSARDVVDERASAASERPLALADYLSEIEALRRARAPVGEDEPLRLTREPHHQAPLVAPRRREPAARPWSALSITDYPASRRRARLQRRRGADAPSPGPARQRLRPLGAEHGALTGGGERNAAEDIAFRVREVGRLASEARRARETQGPKRRPDDEPSTS